MITIYHNPRCSKSRETLALVQEFTEKNRLGLDIVDYQKAPLTLGQLSALREKLGGSVRAMVRDNEEEYAALNLAKADEPMLLLAIAEHPTLLQRPIVAWKDRAVIGRPPEHVLGLLEQILANG